MSVKPVKAEIAPRSGVIMTTHSDHSRVEITWASPGFELLTGYDASEVLGKNPGLLQGPNTDPRTIAMMHTAIVAASEFRTTILNYRADGTPFWNELAIAPRRRGDDPRAEIVEWVGALHDVTDEMLRGAKLHQLERYDQATGMPNDVALHDEMRSALNRARVHDSELAVLLIDIEDLPLIQQRLGRFGALPLQRSLADRLSALVRPGDMLARIDDDEFCLLLSDVPREAERVATELAARIQNALRETFDVDGRRIELLATIGIAIFPGAISAAELLTEAGIAVGLARDGGREVACFHHRSRHEEITADAAFAPAFYRRELADIIARGAITSVLAPVVAFEDGAVVALEAYARGPTGSALHLPERLRDAASSADLLTSFDRAGHEAGISAAAAVGAPPGSTVFLNVTPATLLDPAAAGLLADTDYDVIVDIAADDLIAEPAKLLRAASAWQQIGGRIALDDVGADPRLLGLMPLLDPDVIKLDLARIQTRPPAERARVATTVAALRERSGTVVLAEWVETPDDAFDAIALGADIGSGLRYGAPSVDADIPTRRLALRPPVAIPSIDATPLSLLGYTDNDRSLSGSAIDRTMGMVEQRALGAEGALLLAVVPDAAVINPDRIARLRSLARRSALVAVIGPGVSEHTIAGVVTAESNFVDTLDGQWTTIALGADLAIAVAATPASDTRTVAPRFTLVRCSDPELVAAAARSLLPRLA